MLRIIAIYSDSACTLLELHTASASHFENGALHLSTEQKVPDLFRMWLKNVLVTGLDSEGHISSIVNTTVQCAKGEIARQYWYEQFYYIKLTIQFYEHENEFMEISVMDEWRD